METFLTRSVMDNENPRTFKPPQRVNEEADWPVTIKWAARDPRSQRPENNEGEFDPELLLRYGLERINLPSGKKLFSWLIRQSVIQRYFVTLFWLIKVKFFETDESSSESEAYLLRLMAIEYRQIVELMAFRAHAEHEKDFAFKYLPFILSNSVYFGFYFIFPGSRHIYTKGFKKTVYMQVIQLMHGIQLCPATVKVSWAKLFPEDNHEDGDEGEDGGESFPVQIALKVPKFGREHEDRQTAAMSMGSADDSSIASDTSKNTRNTKNTNNTDKFSVRDLPPVIVKGRLPSAGKRTKFAELASDDMSQTDHRGMPGMSLTQSLGIALPTGGIVSSSSPSPSHLHRHHALGGTGLTINSKLDVRNLRRSVSVVLVGNNPDELMSSIKQASAAMSGGGGGKNSGMASIDAEATLVDDSPRTFNVHGPNDSFFAGASKQGYIKAQNHLTLENFFENPGTQEPLLRTFLKPQLERPKNKFAIKRQNNFEAMNAQEMSPQMQLYLSTMEATAGAGMGKQAQTLRRTVPVNWCAAGGSYTHKKRVVATDLHSEISAKLRTSEYEFRRQTSRFHRMRTQSLQEIDAATDRAAVALYTPDLNTTFPIAVITVPVP
eukprot:gene22731-28887_t